MDDVGVDPHRGHDHHAFLLATVALGINASNRGKIDMADSARLEIGGNLFRTSPLVGTPNFPGKQVLRTCRMMQKRNLELGENWCRHVNRAIATDHDHRIVPLQGIGKPHSRLFRLGGQAACLKTMRLQNRQKPFRLDPGLAGA